MNEVELTSANFTSSRGVQTTVKDYINRSISDVLNAELNWPFTRAEGSVDAIAGKQLYSFASIASTLKYIDYDNVFLQPKDYIANGATVIHSLQHYQHQLLYQDVKYLILYQ